MADLLSILAESYRANPNAVIGGMEAGQNFMNNALLYQQRREAMEAQRSLKDLYARNPQPAFEELAKIDPAFAMQQQAANFDLQNKMLGAQKTQREISAMEGKSVAETLGPIAERALQSGDIEAYKREMGRAASELAAQGIPLPMNFSPDQHPPEMVLQNAFAKGYKSPMMENQAAFQRESMMRGIPPAPTAQQYYGYQDPREYGTRRVPGLFNNAPQGMGVTPFAPPSVQQEAYTTEGAMPSGMQPAPMTNVAEDIAKMKAVRSQMAAGRQRDAMDKMIADLEAGNVGQPNAAPASAGGFVTPADEMRMRAEEERLKSQLETEKQLNVEKGKQEMQEQFAARKAVNAYDMLPDPNRIRNLIKGSISGDTEYWANRLGGVVGKSLESGDVTAALKVIEGQMADTVAMFPGAQSDKELEARMKTIGDPSAAISADTRLKAFDFWLERMQKYVTQHADFDDTKLLDMVKEQKLTADQAMAIRKKRMAGGR